MSLEKEQRESRISPIHLLVAEGCSGGANSLDHLPIGKQLTALTCDPTARESPVYRSREFSGMPGKNRDISINAALQSYLLTRTLKMRFSTGGR